jgi:hypothetical protein
MSKVRVSRRTTTVTYSRLLLLILCSRETPEAELFRPCHLSKSFCHLSHRNGGSSSSSRLWAAVSVRAFESEESKARRAELKKQREARALTERISSYARKIHQQFPTGDVVVNERDLAEQLRKRTDVVVTALNLLLNEEKVQQAPLNGYWKLNP